jgi:hypothetical protein
MVHGEVRKASESADYQLLKHETRYEIEFIPEYFGSNTRLALESCKSEGVPFKASDGCRVYRPKGCKHKLCPGCSEGEVKKLVSHTLKQLDLLGKETGERVNWWGAETTIPADMWQTVGANDYNLKIFEKISVDAITRALYAVHGVDSAEWVFGFEVVTQISGSDDPFSGLQPHCHITGWNRIASRDDKRMVRITVSLSPREVETFSSICAELLQKGVEAHFGQSRWQPNPSNKNSHWNVHYEYGNGTYRSLRHRLDYCDRSMVRDVRKFIESGKGVSTSREYVQRLLLGTKGKKRVQGYGWWAPNCRQKYLSYVIEQCYKCGHVSHFKTSCRSVLCRCDRGSPVPTKKSNDRESRRTFCTHGFEMFPDYSGIKSLSEVKLLTGEFILG